jgi:type VI secretion system protein VasG
MADLSLEAVAGKLNRVGYEAFFKALRQAKGAGNRALPISRKPSAAISGRPPKISSSAAAS